MSQSLTKTNAPDQIDCLLIPLKDKNLILPNVAVAEIVPFSHLLTTASNVDWMLGRIDWRGVPIPVVCYEMLCNQGAPAPNPNARFAIINGVGDHAQMPFYAMLVQGIPRLMHINESDIQKVDALNVGAFDQSAVSIGQEAAVIPNLDLVEQELIKQL
ncbi:chemotaxis protein CheW [Bacterioplanoides sp.]|uniref:chemotaxis protein CheW n=1 Tax=Bacterioplanoides sp. TaxID=2066072 RepID=UPI003AFFF2B1